MRDIEETIKAGERNRETMTLVQNYCAHARVEKFGGVGLIEQTTGLPIGHHGMRCEQAPDGGLSSWDLRDAVIDFYDRNCAGCSFRKPVRLPNILEIIADRDRERAAQSARDEAAAQLEAAALAKRQEARSSLNPALGPIARTLLDDIGAYDANRSKENFERVTQSARLAPEHFNTALVDYVLELSVGEEWFRRAGLIILDAVGTDAPKIVQLAILMLRHRQSIGMAAEKLLPRIELVEASSVSHILRACIDLAAPDQRGVIDDASKFSQDPRLLLELYARFHQQLLGALENMLLSRKRHEVERAGRGIQALQRARSAAADPILRTLISVYIRAPSLIDDLKEDDDRLPGLARALNKAFDQAPSEVDRVLQELLIGASVAQRARVARAYAMALHTSEGAEVVGVSRQNTALHRLIWIPTTEREDEVVGEVITAFRSHLSGLSALIRVQLDSFIGALFLMADRLVELKVELDQPSDNPLLRLERNSRCTRMRSLIETYIERVGAAARGDSASTAKIIAMFDAIPEGRDELRGALLMVTKELAKDVVGLQLLLPHLYSALVGTSVIGRSYAAKAVGELPYSCRDHVPSLLFEAFTVLLDDEYVMVHKAAVAAFQRSLVSETHRVHAALAIYNLVRHYRTRSNEDSFLADCVELLAGMIDLFGPNSGSIRRYLIDVAMDIEPVFLRSSVNALAYTLGEEPAFAKLAARMLPEFADRTHGDERGAGLIQRVGVQGLQQYSDHLFEAALLVVEEDLLLSLAIVEAFLNAGMNAEAERLVAALLAKTGESVRFRRRRTLLRWPQLALQFERAVEARDLEGIAKVAADWEDAVIADRRDEEDERDRRARSSLPF